MCSALFSLSDMTQLTELPVLGQQMGLDVLLFFILALGCVLLQNPGTPILKEDNVTLCNTTHLLIIARNWHRKPLGGMGFDWTVEK